MHISMSRTIRHYVVYNPLHHITQYGVSNPRTCTGAELLQLSIHPRDIMCMFISNGLTIPKRSPAWPTQSPKLSRVQVYRVTVFPIRLKMGLCADTRCLQGASFVIILLISSLLEKTAVTMSVFWRRRPWRGDWRTVTRSTSISRQVLCTGWILM